MKNAQIKCPNCLSGSRVEINMKADGFAQNIFECGLCGALWTLNGSIEVLLASNKDGFCQGSGSCAIRS